MFDSKDIEIPKETLDTLVKSDPALTDFVTKAVWSMRTDEKTRLACFSSPEMNREFLKYLLYRLNMRRDVEFLEYLACPVTMMHKQVAGFLKDEYDLAKKDYEMSLASDWIASGNEKSAAAKVLSVLRRETWGDKGSNTNNFNAPTQILFGEKDTRTPQEKVGWEGIDKFAAEHVEGASK